MLEFSRNSVDVFGFSIRYYGIVIALGMLLGVIVAMRREKQLGLPKETALDITLVCIPAAIVCARIYYVIFEWEMYRGDIRAMLDIRSGGLAIYGGLIGAFIAGAIYAKVKKISFAALADLAAPSIAIGQAIGRWGNFFNQEAYGIEITKPALQFFPMGVYIAADSAWHYATFFYESVWCALLAVFLIVADKKGFFRRRGDVVLWYAMLYGLERAFVEGLRTDSLYIGLLRVSQALSIVLIFGATVIFCIRAGKFRRLRIGAAVVAGAAVLMSLAGFIYPALAAAAAAVVVSCAVYPKIEKRIEEA